MLPVRSYRTLSPLPCMHGGLLSVALSFELPRLAVNQHHALWSSDFPPALSAGDHPFWSKNSKSIKNKWVHQTSAAATSVLASPSGASTSPGSHTKKRPQF